MEGKKRGREGMRREKGIKVNKEEECTLQYMYMYTGTYLNP